MFLFLCLCLWPSRALLVALMILSFLTAVRDPPNALSSLPHVFARIVMSSIVLMPRHTDALLTFKISVPILVDALYTILHTG
jgi:hypothetical protein